MPHSLSKHDYEILADFRYQIRCFLRFSEEVVQQHGITAQQYQLLLQVKGYPDREWATIGELAERLQAHHHGVVSLASRCEKLGLVKRSPGRQDRRCVEVHLTEEGSCLLDKLARLHRDQLQALQTQWKLPTFMPTTTN